MNWKQIGIVCGAIMGLAAVFGLVYRADCWNIDSHGQEKFTTIDTYIAGQQKVWNAFDQRDLQDKIRQVRELDEKYGPGCERCDTKLKQYYDYLIIERNRLIKALQESG